MTTPPRYFVGKSVVSTILEAHPASTFKEFASKIFDPLFTVPVTRAEFHALPKTERDRIKRSLPCFVAATSKAEVWKGRLLKDAQACNLIALDIDDSAEAARLINNKELFEKNLPFNFVAYTTATSTHESPKLRIVVEGDKIPVKDYAAAVKTVVRLLGVKVFDPASTNPAQPMILPFKFKGDDDWLFPPQEASFYGYRPFTVADITHGERAEITKPIADSADSELNIDSLENLKLPEPGITLNDARNALAKLSADTDYLDWIKIAMPLKHQFGDEGFELFDSWSSSGGQYEGTAETHKKWTSFKKRKPGLPVRGIRSLFQDALKASWDGKLESGECWLLTGSTAGDAALVQPVPLAASLPPVKPFDPAWLPASFAPWVSDIAERMQCPVEYPAIAAMTALSSVAGRRFCIQPKEHDQEYSEFAHLWGMLIGPPSLMKSPSMQAALRPIRKMEKEAFQVFDDMEHERKAAEIAAKYKRSARESEARSAAKAGAEFDYASLIEEEGEASPCRRFIVNDASLEALGEVLRSNPTGTLLYQDELAGLMAMLEKDNNQCLRTFLLQAWSGKEGFTFDRIGRGTRRIEACAISVLGSIQPGVIARHVRAANGTAEGADGFMQRFSLMVWPDNSKNWKNIDRPIDQAAEQQAAEVFRSMEALTPESLLAMGATAGRDDIPTFRFSADAQERFNKWRESLEHRLRAGGMSSAFEAHLGKYRKLVPALAVLIHVAEQVPGPVTLSALERALSWAACLESHAARVYGSAIMAECEAAKTLLHKLRDGSACLADKFTAREVRRKCWAGLTLSEEVDAACDLLTDHHWLITTQQPTTGTGGRPTQFYTLNPLAKSSECPLR